MKTKEEKVRQERRRIRIFDTTLRDGEQSPGASLTQKEKLVIAKQLALLKVDVIEAGFPASSRGDFEAVETISRHVEGPVICGLARTSEEDIDRCWKAIRHAGKSRIHTFIATSRIHMKKKLKKTRREVMEMAVDAVKRARCYTDDVEFSPEDASRTGFDFLCDVVRAAMGAGATTINIPDTVGYSEPEEFGERVRRLLECVPEAREVTISVHCHDDLGNAVANSLAGVRNGATQVECCINGIGERAGNASTEEVVMNLFTRRDYFCAEVGIDTKELFKTSRLVSSLTGLEVQRNKAVVGRNAFAHEAGIHQHGVLCSSSTYEVMSPSTVGWKGESIVIGKHSGKHAITNLLKEEKCELTRKQMEEVTLKVKELADKQKSVEREDVIAIAQNVASNLSEEEQLIKLKEFLVTTGSNVTPTASAIIEIAGEERTVVGLGVGPVDALSNALQSLTGSYLRLLDFSLKAVTGGTNALADVRIRLEDRRKNVYSARGIDEDIVKASAIAMIRGVNKALLNKKRKKEG